MRNAKIITIPVGSRFGSRFPTDLVVRIGYIGTQYSARRAPLIITSTPVIATLLYSVSALASARAATIVASPTVAATSTCSHRRPFRRRRWRHCGWCVAMRHRHCPSMTSTYHAHPSRVVGTETRSVWRGAGTPRQEVDNQGSTERRLARSVGVLAPARQTQAMSILRHLRNGHFQSARRSPSSLSSAQARRVHLWNTDRQTSYPKANTD